MGASRRQLEEELLREVKRLADDYHLLLFHCRDSRGSLGSGFPDLVIAGKKGYVFAELKSEYGALTPDQRKWGSALLEGGGVWLVWRPADLVSGAIEKTLAEIAIYKQESLA